MADFNDYVQSNTSKVGPAPSTGSGTTLDQQRRQDFGDYSNVSPKDLKASLRAAKAPQLSEVEKHERFTRAAQGALEATLDGGSTEEVNASANANWTEYNKAPRFHRSVETAPVIENTDQTQGLKELRQAQRANERWLKLRSDVGVGDMAGAAWQEMSGTAAAVRAVIDQWNGARDFKPDPMFDPLEGRENWGANRPLDEQEWIADSSSAEERMWKLGRLNQQRENFETLGAHGAGAATFFSLGAGILDPVGWVAGMGVGKAAQLANVGTKLYGASRILAGAAEGAAGNILTEAAIQASGEHVTAADYGYAAAFGTLFGAGGAAIATRARVVHQDNVDVPGVHREADAAAHSASEQAEALREGSLNHMAGIWEEAQRRAGPDADQTLLKETARVVEQERMRAFTEASVRPLGDSERLAPDIDMLAGQNAEGTGDIAGGLTQGVNKAFAPQEVRDAVGSKYGISADTMPDNADRLWTTEMFHRAEQNAPQFDEDRLNVMSKLLPKKLQATGMILARSEHPLLRWWAANMLEMPTRAAGARTTAAVEHAIREREYSAFIARDNEFYAAWRNQNGGSAIKDVFLKTGHYSEFQRMVSDARRARAMGQELDLHPTIKKAADNWDEAYERLRVDQQKSKTLGSENLPDSSRGYFARSVSAKWLIANPAKQGAFRKAIEKQLFEQWKDFDNGAKYAKETAARYVDRAIREAHGGGDVPINMHDKHAAAGLRDALAQGTNLSKDDIEKYLDRISRGGAQHTRGRLDLDLGETAIGDDGVEFKLSDAFVNDQAALFRSQARRVNGEVTLARRGILGDRGIRVMRDAIMLRHADGKSLSPAELEAFDQTVAEFMGRPFGKSVPALDTLRIWTMVSKLGQAVVPQLAETGNMAATLGVGAAMRFTKDLPRLVQDVRKGRDSELLKSLEIPGGRLGDEHQAVMPWQDIDEIEVAGRDAPSVLGRALRGASNAQALVTGFRYLHAAQVRGASEQIILKALRYTREGSNDAAMKSMGFSDELREAVRKELPNIAEFDADGNVTKLDIRSSTDPQAMLAFQQVVERGAKQIIQGTFIGERGAFMHDSFLRLLTQFRSFSLTSMDKQFSRVRADQGTAKALGLLLGQMSFAIPIHLGRVSLNAASMADDRRQEYLETQLAPGMLARATLNYASLGGLMGDIVDAGAAAAGLEMSGARTGQSSFSSNIPAVGAVDGAARAITNRDLSGMVKALPGGNTMFLTPVANGLHALQND